MSSGGGGELGGRRRLARKSIVRDARREGERKSREPINESHVMADSRRVEVTEPPSLQNPLGGRFTLGSVAAVARCC